MKTPASAAIEWDQRPITPGICGRVECIHASMAYQGLDIDLDELLCVSSAPFANYLYAHEVNQHDELTYSDQGELFTNYGIFESVGYYTGWQLMEIERIADDELWKVIKYELLLDRPIVSIGCVEPLQPVMVTGYEEQGAKRLITVHTDTETRTIDLRETKPQGDSEVFVNFMGIIRPSESPDWAASLNKQRMTVLRWAAKHATSKKEFFHETRENYHTGQLALEVLPEFLQREHDDNFWPYIANMVRSRVRSRTAAANRLGDWGRDLAAELNEPRVEESLNFAAELFGKAVDALKADDVELTDALTQYAKHEYDANHCLRDVAELLPSPFG